MHLLGVGDELLPEIGVGDVDELLGPLPGGQALQVDHAVLGDDVVDAGPGVGGDGAGGQGGDDAALDGAVLAGDGGGHADEALAALGQVSAQGEVQLAAGAGDVFDAGGLGVDLSEQVHIDGVIDGNKVIDLADNVDVIGVIHRSGHDIRIPVDIVVELLGTGSESKDLAATVQSGYLPVLDEVLAKGKGICFDYAALMTAMLRSQGVPCKLVTGYVGTSKPAYHAWISVWSQETGWVDGAIYFDGAVWQRMDPTFASSGSGSEEIVQYIGDGKNYSVKYFY